MVRVYAHNLRQKLNHYYTNDGPRRAAADRDSEGRVSRHGSFGRNERPADEAPVAPTGLTRLRLAAAAVVLVVIGAAVGFVIGAGGNTGGSGYGAVAASPIWRELFDDDLPVLVVVGDYFIVGRT